MGLGFRVWGIEGLLGGSWLRKPSQDYLHAGPWFSWGLADKGRWPLYLLPLYLNAAPRYPKKNPNICLHTTETLLKETTNPYRVERLRFRV